MQHQFTTQKECLLYFEKLRWGNTVKCPYCLSKKTHPAKSEQGRHFCYDCVKSFSVLIGTIFEDTRLQLPFWINIIKSMLQQEGIISVKKISEDSGVTLKTAWLTAMKIRCAMIDDNSELKGLLSLDKNYVGDKRKKNINKNSIRLSRVQRLTNISKGKNAEELTSVNLIALLKDYIKHDENNLSAVSRSYKNMDKTIELITEKHNENTGAQKKKSFTDNYWSFIKNGIRNDSKSLSSKYLPFYLLEYEYKFKRRNVKKNLFTEFMKNIFLEKTKVVDFNERPSKKQKQVAYA